jgi:hypothetical protein
MMVSTDMLAVLSTGNLYMVQPYFAAARPHGPAPMMQMDCAVVRRSGDVREGIALNQI